MNAIPVTPETIGVARRVIWFESPEQALAQPTRFLAYAMSYASHEDMRIIRRFVSDDEFREALDHAPPGIIDSRSWAYWNAKMGRYPSPPMPRRKLEGHGWIRRAPARDTEEIRRQAREQWRATYGPDAQKKKPRS